MSTNPRASNFENVLYVKDSVSALAAAVTGFSLTGIEAIATAIVDGNGTQITSFGGGTQYTDAGIAPAHPIGNTIEWNNAGTWATAGSSAPLPVTATLVANGAVNIAQFGGSAVTIGQQLAAASLPVILPSATITTLTPPAAITGFALEAGHLATIDTSTARIPVQGQALAAASMPVVLPAAQITTLTPPTTVTVTQATGTNLHAVIDSGTITAVTGITNALPAGTNVIGHVIVDSGAITANPTTPSALVAFVTAVTTAGTRVQLANNAISGCILQAPSTNTGKMYIGGSTVSSTVFGAELQPGQATSVAVNNTNLIYIDASVSGEKVAVLGS